MDTTRIIFIKGAIETLEFFSIQLAKAFEAQGFQTWFWDLKAPLSSREAFEALGGYDSAILLTFNFIGLSGESQFQYGPCSIWEQHNVKTYCIMADHPMYYHRLLASDIKNLALVCIDRGHQAFTEHYYPNYGKVHFLPLAGTKLPGEPTPFAERDIDVVFAGNYVPPEHLTPHIQHMDEESKAFYFDIIKELTEHPERPMEQELVSRLEQEFPKITREETLSCLHSMVFIDLYVRSLFRREVICTLAEHGIPVTVIGKGWENSGCKCPENIIIAGQRDSRTCLEYMQHARISVNVMPWFKDGAHDRIFNGMLQGCVVVTDSSAYLDEILCDGKDYAGFQLGNYGEISQKVDWLLKHPKEAEAIAEAGRRKASEGHTWEQRAYALGEIFRKG